MNKTYVSLNEAATLIRHTGFNVTYILRGEPGVGKSTILKMLSGILPDYRTAYIDCACLDLGDASMPVIDREAMVTNYAPNARFGLKKGDNTPVIIMLDELGKAARPVLNMLLPLILEKRLGDVETPPGSIIFATTNLDTDGVGDNIPAHAYNRMTELVIRKPSANEWIQWAQNNGVSAEVMTFAVQEQQVFQSYVELAKGDKNPYIFNPMNGVTRTFCSPRSLEKASNVLKGREKFGDATTLAALIGTIGEAAAKQMEVLVNLSDQLVPFDVIVKNPKKAKLPEGAGAQFIMAFRLASAVTEETVEPVIEYVQRLKLDSFEAASLCVSSIVNNQSKLQWASRNRKFLEEVKDLSKYFG